MAQPPFDTSVQNNFPISSVIDAYQRQAALKQQADEYGQQQLIKGAQDIGAVGQSLLDRRRAMAQAMAGAQYIQAKNPELFSPTTTTTQQPVSSSQTAQGTDDQGNLLSSPVPNTGNQGALTTRPQSTTTPPAMDTRTMATALYGTPFNDLLKTGFEQHKLDVDTGLRKQELAQSAQRNAIEAQNVQMQRLIQGLLASNTIKNQAQERSQAAANERLDANKEIAKHWLLHPIDAYNASQAISAAGQGSDNSKTDLPDVGQTISHPSGVKITRIK